MLVRTVLLNVALLASLYSAYADSTIAYSDAETFALSTFVVRGAAVALAGQSETAHQIATKEGLEAVVQKQLLVTFRVDDWLMGTPPDAMNITLTIPVEVSADASASTDLALLLQGSEVVLPITAVALGGKQATSVITFSRVYPVDTEMHLDNLSSILVDAEAIRASRIARTEAQSQSEQP